MQKAKLKDALPALAPDTALEMALLEIALFRFMMSSNSASLTVEGGGPESGCTQKYRDHITPDGPHRSVIHYPRVLCYTLLCAVLNDSRPAHMFYMFMFSSKTGFMCYTFYNFGMTT